MMRNSPELHIRLQSLGLSADEAKIFVCLLDGQKTQLQISREVDIARSSVYRLVDGLIEKSLVHEITTDEGKLLEAANPDALELLVIEHENEAKRQRAGLNKVVAMLDGLQASEKSSAIKTYSGKAGIKQMLWNELKVKGETLIFSCGTANPGLGKQWAEKYRRETLERKLQIRWLENPEFYATENSAIPEYVEYMRQNIRLIDSGVLPISHEMTIHDDTISLYSSWTDEVQLGTEIQNPILADFMRKVFEHYWQLGTAPK